MESVCARVLYTQSVATIKKIKKYRMEKKKTHEGKKQKENDEKWNGRKKNLNAKSFRYAIHICKNCRSMCVGCWFLVGVFFFSLFYECAIVFTKNLNKISKSPNVWYGAKPFTLCVFYRRREKERKEQTT